MTVCSEKCNDFFLLVFENLCVYMYMYRVYNYAIVCMIICILFCLLEYREPDSSES